MRKTYQVVFLIDVSQGTKLEEDDDLTGRRLTTIRLSALKLLTYLANQISPSSISKNFRWGCKFYNPITNFSEKIDFCEFDHKNFDDFENRLESVFEGEKKKQHDIALRRRANAQLGYDNLDHFGTPQENDEVDPGKCLKDNLTNLLHDFQWDRPEITSPVRPSFQRRGSKRMLVPNEPMYYNFLWLLSECPKTVEDIQKYTLCGVKYDSESVFSYVLPPMVYSQFYEQRRIRFFWLDLGSSFPESKHIPMPGVASMHGALSRVQGGVVPLAALLQVTSLQNSCSQSPCRPSQLLLPLSVLLRYYMAQQSLQAVGENDATPQNTTVQLKGLPGAETLALTLSPLCGNSFPQSRNEAPSSPSMNWLELIAPDDTCERKIPLANSLTTGNHAVQGLVLVGGLLHCQGLLRANEVPLQLLLPQMSYLVTSTSKEVGSAALVSFPSVLQVLAAHNLVMIVNIHNQFSSTHLSGVLRPLSGTSATLSFVHSDVSLQLEKLLHFGTLEPHSQSANESIDEFVQGCIGRLLKDRTAQIQEVASKVDTAQDQTASAATLRPTWLEKWLPPHITTVPAKPLMTHLKQRTNPALADEERSLMRRLRDHQCRQRQPAPMESSTATADAPQPLRRSPRKSTQRSHSRASPKKSPHKSPAKNKRSVTVMGRTRSFTAPVNSRCAYIFKKSKEVVAQQKDDPSSPQKLNPQASQAQNEGTQLPQTDFQDVSELLSHLETVYTQGVEGERSSLPCAQYLINVALHYIKFTERADPQVSTVQLFRQQLLRTASDIRQKYDKHGSQSGGEKEDRVRELELQIILRLELHSLLLNDSTEDFDVDTVVQEVVAMLRSLSFLMDTGYLNQFLQDSLLHNYVSSIPRFLYLVYEELLQPLPPALLGFCSPQDDDNMDSVQPPSNASSSFSEGMSCRSADLEQSRRSTRSRRSVTTFTSFNMGRQITIPGKAKKSKQHTDKEKEKMKTRSSARKKSPKEETGPKCEVRKVRRNLFAGGGSLAVGSGMERRQSVAVMEGITQPPSTPPRRKQGSKTLHTPKSHHILKTKTVLETPVHKQKGKAIWRKQEAKRRHTDSLTSVDVVQESPDKAIHDGKSEGSKKPSLGRRASVAVCRRKSFYSTAPENKSRNLEKYCQSKYNLLEARMAGKGSSPSSRAKCRTTPPRRINPVLFSQLNTPSPPKSAIKRTLFSSSQPCMSSPMTPNKVMSPLVGSTQVTVTPTKTIVPSKAVKRITLGSPLKQELNTGQENNPSPFRSPQTRARLKASSPPDVSPEMASRTSPDRKSVTNPSELTDDLSLDTHVLCTPDRPKRQAATSSQSDSGSDKENSPVFGASQSASSSCFLSPRRSQRLAGPETGSDSGGNVSPTLGKANKLATTPSHKRPAKKSCRTPESLDQWPRRKSRSMLYSPSSQPSVSQDTAPSQPSVEDMDTSIPSSPVLRRRVARKPRHCSLSSPLAGSRGSSLSSPHKGLTSDSHFKRKRVADADVEYSAVSSQVGTPHKKQRVSVSESIAGGKSPDYFSSQEVFIEGDTHPTHSSLLRHTSEASEGWPSPTRSLLPADVDDSSWSLNSKTSTSESANAPQSPIFKPNFLKQHSSGLHSDLSNDSEALPSSPVLRQHVDTLLQRLDSDESTTSSSGRQLHRSPVLSPSGKKFSPVCAKSLAHLMSSPLLSATSSEPAPTTNNSKAPRRGAKSRRTLMYRSQSKANIK